jgi:hypothetical protein
MQSGSQNHFPNRREVLRQQMAANAVEIARLQAQNDQLTREDERLRIEEEQASVPLLIGVQRLLEMLDISERGFRRLRANTAKAFPAPVTSIDSDPRWLFSEVRDWLVSTRGSSDLQTVAEGCNLAPSGACKTVSPPSRQVGRRAAPVRASRR